MKSKNANKVSERLCDNLIDIAKNIDSYLTEYFESLEKGDFNDIKIPKSSPYPAEQCAAILRTFVQTNNLEYLHVVISLLPNIQIDTSQTSHNQSDDPLGAWHAHLILNKVQEALKTRIPSRK